MLTKKSRVKLTNFKYIKSYRKVYELDKLINKRAMQIPFKKIYGDTLNDACFLDYSFVFDSDLLTTHLSKNDKLYNINNEIYMSLLKNTEVNSNTVLAICKGLLVDIIFTNIVMNIRYRFTKLEYIKPHPLTLEQIRSTLLEYVPDGVLKYNHICNTWNDVWGKITNGFINYDIMNLIEKYVYTFDSGFDYRLKNNTNGYVTIFPKGTMYRVRIN